MRLVVEISRTSDGHLEGRIRSHPKAWTPYSGVLELLKVLEEQLDGQTNGF
jgi:hypothetical protein